MLAQLRFRWLASLPLAALVAACALNPQPEPPMDPTRGDAAPGTGGQAGSSVLADASSAGGSSLGGSAGAAGGLASDAAPPNDEGGCYDCACPCGAVGECDAGADGSQQCNCPCDAGADCGIDANPKPEAGDSDATQSDANEAADATDAELPD